MELKKFLTWGIGIVVVVAFFMVNNRKEETTVENKNYTEVSAEHILVDSEEKASELFKDINDGKISFEDCAREYSKCPSGKNGGSLGYFKKGVMVKEFEDAAFGAEKGKIVGPVQTKFGWHLIKVIDKR